MKIFGLMKEAAGIYKPFLQDQVQTEYPFAEIPLQERIYASSKFAIPHLL